MQTTRTRTGEREEDRPRWASRHGYAPSNWLPQMGGTVEVCATGTKEEMRTESEEMRMLPNWSLQRSTRQPSSFGGLYAGRELGQVPIQYLSLAGAHASPPSPPRLPDIALAAATPLFTGLAAATPLFVAVMNSKWFPRRHT